MTVMSATNVKKQYHKNASRTPAFLPKLNNKEGGENSNTFEGKSMLKD